MFDEDLKVLWAGLRHLPEHRLPGLVDQVHPIEEQHVKVDVQVQRRAEALDQRHGAGVANGAGSRRATVGRERVSAGERLKR